MTSAVLADRHPARRRPSRRLLAMTMRIVTTAAIALAILPVEFGQGAAPSRAPNIVIILADDLGYSDLGCYGSEIKTPNLDALADNGVRFTQFYNTARCWPTRAALLTGYYAQQVRRDTLPGLRSGSQGKRPAWARLLPEMLKPLGYHSYHSGKWHVDGMPVAQGFEHSYLLQDTGRYFHPREHFEDDRKLPAVEPDSGYYATTAIADHAIQSLKDHAAHDAGQPFFQYVAFTSPHFPLHALPEDIARYRDIYRAGWDAIRQQRWKRQQELKLGDGELSPPERDLGPPYDFPEAMKTLGKGEINRPVPWSELSDEQREFQAAKMAVHAAMVDRIDREIGRVLEQIRAMDAWDNTVICFLSDNGASAEIMVRDDGHDPQAPAGSAASHLCLGPGWSTVSNTPFRRHKTWVHEGGIATPLIVHWPQGIAARGELRNQPGHVIDVVPTLLEISGGKWLEPQDGQPLPPAPGKSLVPAFKNAGEKIARDDLWWLHEGNRAIRMDGWKLVAAKDQPWELYDLHADRSETKDLSQEFPDRVRELSARWEKRLGEFSELAQRDAADSPAPKRDRKSDSVAKPVKELILPGESFLVADRPAFILLPEEGKRKTPQPWVYYAPTLPGYPDVHEKWMHEQFLAAGVAVAGIDVDEAYGSPKGRQFFTTFYEELTGKRGFAKRPCMLGRSRGGLWVSSWASEHPDKVAGLAGIYPVFDFRTYPGIEKAAPAYGLTPQQLSARLAELNPIEQITRLAEKRVPALFIHGDEDTVVPLQENSAEFRARYRAAGVENLVTLIVAKGQGHNFWEGFFRCQELVDFAIARARAGAQE